MSILLLSLIHICFICFCTNVMSLAQVPAPWESSEKARVNCSSLSILNHHDVSLCRPCHVLINSWKSNDFPANSRPCCASYLVQKMVTCLGISCPCPHLHLEFSNLRILCWCKKSASLIFPDLSWITKALCALGSPLWCLSIVLVSSCSKIAVELFECDFHLSFYHWRSFPVQSVPGLDTVLLHHTVCQSAHTTHECATCSKEKLLGSVLSHESDSSLHWISAILAFTWAHICCISLAMPVCSSVFQCLVICCVRYRSSEAI